MGRRCAPRTLPAAFAPVIAGTAAAGLGARPVYGYALLALVVALALQVGVNYANDYSDGIRGTDADRVGPVRLVGQRLALASNVKLMAFLCFGFAGIVGLALVALSGAWLMLPIGVPSVIAAWKYTGGERPHGYSGWGEVFVFVFFGLVATLGTQYTHYWGTSPGSGCSRPWASAPSPPRSSSSTTCATSPGTPSPASARSRFASATGAPDCCGSRCCWSPWPRAPPW